jgi:glutamine amidotransferase
MIVTIDYGMGNLFSVQSALNYLGAKSTVSSSLDVIAKADKLILPGVGSFHQAMINLKKDGIAQTIKQSVIDKKVPILGICLGMQLLAQSSTEDGFSEGLGFIESPIERFNASNEFKIPHVGFETVVISKESKLMQGLGENADFYFTHSYRMDFKDQSYAAGTCAYSGCFIAAFEQQHICGTQFHPEKSQTNGLRVLKNFIEKF